MAQLTRKVRALPRCKAPVGEGARRVVGLDIVGYPSGMANPTANPEPPRLAVLLSGGGTTMQNLADQIANGQLNASIRLVISSNAKAGGLERAGAMKLPALTIDRKGFATPDAMSEQIFEFIRGAEIDLVCLAGYLCLLPVPDDYTRRVINIHPALLPSFGGKGLYGRRVHEAVLTAGAKISGCTVHFCDQTYDTGPIIVQRTCPVLEDDTPDTLAKRVFEQECIAYPEAIRLIAQGRVTVQGRCTRILPPDR